MTTQDDESKPARQNAKTQLRPSANDWTLTPRSPEQSGEVHPVRGEMVVGREDCDIKLLGGHVSRQHAKLSVSAGALRVEDLGSTNGTFVNDERVETAELKPGDEVRFDTEAFLVGGPQAPAAQDDKKTALRPAGREQAPEPERKTETEKKPEAGKKKAKKKVAAKKKKKAAAAKSEEKEESAPPKEDDKATRKVGEAEAKPQAEEKPKAEEPAKADEKPAAAESGADPADQQPEETGRKAWYERETPNMTRKVESEDLRDQFQEGGTQVVQGVGEVEMPSLIGTSGEWSGHVINLEKDTMTIGRSSTDIILDEPSVSTKHAQVVRDGDRWKVVDLMSANGVYVNGKKTQVAFLSSGDAVRFGRLELRFVTDSTQVSSRAAPEPEQEEVITGSAKAAGKDDSWIYIAIGFIVIVVAAGGYLFLAG